MSENPQEFVKIKPDEDGEQKRYQFGEFTPSGAPQVLSAVMVEVDPDAELRHLTYDDPPHGMTPGEYREMLTAGAQAAVNEEHFVSAVIRAIGKDLVLSHGCHPGKAIPALTEFARKVYAEATGTV